MLKRTVLGILAAVMSVHFLVAQQFDCARWMAQMVTDVDKTCGDITRNILCYGNVTLEVTPRNIDMPLQFAAPGDRVEIAAIEDIKLAGMDPVVPEWGIGLMRVQAALEHTLPGQAVTFVMFGDVSVAGVNQSELPMRSFYLETGIGSPTCHQVPESGVLIQTPQGMGHVNFDINNARISFGDKPTPAEVDSTIIVEAETPEQDEAAVVSPATTVFVTAKPGEAMTFTLIEGRAKVMTNTYETLLTPGTQAVVPLQEDGTANGDMSAVIITNDESITVPVELLPEPVIQPDLNDVQEPVVTVAEPDEDDELIIAVTKPVITTVVTLTDTVVDVVDDVVAPVIGLVPSVVAPVIGVVPTVIAPVVEIIPTVIAPVVEIVPTVIAPVVEIVPTVIAPVVEILPTIIPPVVEIIPTVVAPVIVIVPTVAAPIVEIIPTVVAPVIVIVPTVVSILPTLPPLIPTNLPLLGGLLNP